MLLTRIRARNEWKFFGVLPKADPLLAIAWWVVLVLRGVLPAVFAIAMGVLVGAVQRGDALLGPLALAGMVFVLLQVLTPIHKAISANLGDRTAAWLYDRLTEACVRPPGMGHLEDPKLTSDLTVARDFDLGMTGPPLSISMDFIAGGLVEMIGGLACARRALRATPGGRRSCSAAPGWRRTGCCARARSGATATPTRCAPRSATPTTPTGSRSIRAAGEGAAPVRPRRLDDRSLRRAPHAPARAAVRGDAAAREAGAVEPAARRRRQRRACSGRSPTPPATAA